MASRQETERSGRGRLLCNCTTSCRTPSLVTGPPGVPLRSVQRQEDAMAKTPRLGLEQAIRLIERQETAASAGLPEGTRRRQVVDAAIIALHNALKTLRTEVADLKRNLGVRDRPPQKSHASADHVPSFWNSAAMSRYAGLRQELVADQCELPEIAERYRATRLSTRRSERRPPPRTATASKPRRAERELDVDGVELAARRTAGDPRPGARFSAARCLLGRFSPWPYRPPFFSPPL